MATYNGHRSWNAWNVALWIGNDEPYYNAAMDYLKRAKGNASKAAKKMIRDGWGKMRTPDGGKFNYTCIREALTGLS